jgi:hypothetical protein
MPFFLVLRGFEEFLQNEGPERNTPERGIWPTFPQYLVPVWKNFFKIMGF